MGLSKEQTVRQAITALQGVQNNIDSDADQGKLLVQRELRIALPHLHNALACRQLIPLATSE